MSFVRVTGRGGEDGVEIHRNFTFLCVFMIGVGALLSMGAGFSLAIMPCFVNMICVAVFFYLHCRDPLALRVQIGLTVAMGLCILTYYKAVGNVVMAHPERKLYDFALTSIDDLLLGFAFPHGQIALWTDKNEWIGPTSLVGKLLTEVLTVFYVSYYLWGVVVALLLLRDLGKAHGSNPLKANSIEWSRTQMFMCTWLGTYMLNFLLNLIFPAVSPRLYLVDQYTNPLEGFAIADALNKSVKEAAKGSFGAFPSGHVAISWAVALAGKHHYPFYGKIASYAASLITAATLVLRYHYFIDALGAMVLVYFGLSFGGYIYHPRSARRRGPEGLMSVTGHSV
eukprot:Nk52_evm110s485 gene=Nk52_evmTU110s485